MFAKQHANERKARYVVPSAMVAASDQDYRTRRPSEKSQGPERWQGQWARILKRQNNGIVVQFIYLDEAASYSEAKRQRNKIITVKRYPEDWQVNCEAWSWEEHGAFRIRPSADEAP